jgi:hypothetical protein
VISTAEGPLVDAPCGAGVLALVLIPLMAVLGGRRSAARPHARSPRLSRSGAGVGRGWSCRGRPGLPRTAWQ